MFSKKNGKKQAEATSVAAAQRRFRLDWPLLLYPASILAALAVLYVVSRTIERESPMPRDRGAAREATTPIDNTDQSETTAANTGGVSEVAGGLSVGLSSDMNPAASWDNTQGNIALNTPTGEVQAVDFDQLEGPAEIVSMLRRAVQQEDHALIKRCIDELVALGDEAVVSLTELVSAEGQTGLWAAEVLARIGTPAATAALLDTLAQTEAGQFKDDLGKRVAGITNHDSWPLLLDTLLQTEDAAVARAAVDSLARMADTPVMDEILARYEAATTDAEVECLAQLVSNIQSSGATESLLSLAGDVTSAIQDSLQQAAIDALAKVGDSECASYLLRRLEATTPGEGASIYNAITQINNQDAYAQLLYAAAGNKEVSAESGQTAAIEALANYPCEQTCVLLERIVAEGSNEKVVTAASRTLDAIGRGLYAITASAESFERSEQMFPIASVAK
jgi:hypothetical protein